MEFELRKRHGVYVLDGADAVLRTHWTMRFGRIQTPQGTWSVGVDDVRLPGVTAGPGAHPVVRLWTGQVVLPGTGEPAQWEPSRTSDHVAGRVGDEPRPGLTIMRPAPAVDQGAVPSIRAANY